MKKLIVIGDLHAREKEPYYSQWKDFLNGFFNSEYNTEDNILLLLGDLVESISVQHELLEVYVDYFNNKSKFSKIIILTGNHDRVLDSSLLSLFRPLKNVQVIDTHTTMKLGNCECLFLPHIEQKLVETYSNLDYKQHFDYCFHHIEDQTQHFGKRFTDLSYLNVGHYLCGHIHTETVSTGGHFLGSPTFNSLSEKDKTPYFAVVDLVTKDYELVVPPINVSYLEVTYPNELEVPKTKYGIFTIFDSIDKEQSIEYYTKQASEKGFTFYVRRVHSKRIKHESLQHEDVDYVEKTLLEHFSDYKTINTVEDAVADICIGVLQGIGDK